MDALEKKRLGFGRYVAVVFSGLGKHICGILFRSHCSVATHVALKSVWALSLFERNIVPSFLIRFEIDGDVLGPPANLFAWNSVFKVRVER